MKIKLHLLICLILLSLTSSAQWLQRASFPGTPRARSTSFTVGDKIYVLGGSDNSAVILGDFWEYDITNDTWTQKPAFPGPERYGAVSFVINNNGYVATGGNSNGYLDDLWEYNTTINAWIQRTGLPVTSAQHENQRAEAFSFSIGNNGYVGGGQGFVFGANSTNNIAFYDLWEYNSILNSWTQKADIPDFIGRNMSIAVSMNGKGYVGLGCDINQTINRQSFWEYDPSSDSWNSKSDFPTLFTVDAGAFVLDSGLYVVGGVDLNPVSVSDQFYKYDLATDTWIQQSAFNGGAIVGEFAVSTGTTAFIGGGYLSNLFTRNDLWEFTNATTIINELENNNVTNIFPNPVSDIIFISSRKEICSVEVIDFTGKKVIKEERIKNTINVGSLNSGAYTMKFICKDGSTFVRRFVKTN